LCVLPHLHVLTPKAIFFNRADSYS
jgi:hypothetical protein